MVMFVSLDNISTNNSNEIPYLNLYNLKNYSYVNMNRILTLILKNIVESFCNTTE